MYGTAMLPTEPKLDGLSEIVKDVENFPEVVGVEYSALEKLRLEKIKKRKEILSSSDYYSNLSENALDCASETTNPHLKRVLMERSEQYTKIANDCKRQATAYLALDDSNSMSHKEVPYYKRINAKTRKVIENIAHKATDQVASGLEESSLTQRSEFKKRVRSVYNLVMLSLLLRICVGDDFVTILPQNYYTHKAA
jgi:hypothetical protein